MYVLEYVRKHDIHTCMCTYTDSTIAIELLAILVRVQVCFPALRSTCVLVFDVRVCIAIVIGLILIIIINIIVRTQVL